uniref:Uncharacterized protein n=1 Tax=Rhizophora mucronata TaxID=61149 RepID=A0A2P2IJ91_RHIMU
MEPPLPSATTNGQNKGQSLMIIFSKGDFLHKD